MHQLQHVTSWCKSTEDYRGASIQAGWSWLKLAFPDKLGHRWSLLQPTESRTRSPSACICLATSLASLEPATRLTPQLALPNLNSGNSSCSWHFSFLQMALLAHARKSFESDLPPSLHPWGFQLKANSSVRHNSRGCRGPERADTKCRALRERDRQPPIFVECLAQQTSGKVIKNSISRLGM